MYSRTVPSYSLYSIVKCTLKLRMVNVHKKRARRLTTHTFSQTGGHAPPLHPATHDTHTARARARAPLVLRWGVRGRMIGLFF